MVAQHRARRITERPDESQRCQRLGTAVDQVTGKHQLRMGSGCMDAVQQLLQLIAATLQVADYISRHGSQCSASGLCRPLLSKCNAAISTMVRIGAAGTIAADFNRDILR